MGFGTEILFLLLLGLIFLGPKQMHSMLRYVARTKAEFDRASRSLRAQLDAELETPVERPAPAPTAPELQALSTALPHAHPGGGGD